MTIELAIGIVLICWMWYGLGVHHGKQDAAKKSEEEKND